jgi:hypothetical protein
MTRFAVLPPPLALVRTVTFFFLAFVATASRAKVKRCRNAYVNDGQSQYTRGQKESWSCEYTVFYS